MLLFGCSYSNRDIAIKVAAMLLSVKYQINLVLIVILLAVTIALFSRYHLKLLQYAQKPTQNQRALNGDGNITAICSSEQVLPRFFLLTGDTGVTGDTAQKPGVLNTSLCLHPTKGGDYTVQVNQSIMSQTTHGGNNCLFDAVISSLNARDQSGRRPNSQGLRESCDELLRSENMPLIPAGHPAGEQYLQALSKIFNCGLVVMRNGQHVATVRHSDVSETSPETVIRHMGAALYGHWTS